MDGVNKILYDKGKANLKDKSRLKIDSESKNKEMLNVNSPLINRRNDQLIYRDNLIKSLQDLKNKNNFNNEDFAFKSKFKIHNASIRDDIHLENEMDTSNDEMKISKTNYRTMCDSEETKKLFVSLPCRQNKMNSNGFLSISRQSLNDSASESGISNTASRISASLMSKKSSNNSEKSNTFKSNCNLFSKSYSMKARRYRTIVKQDKFSSYLSRDTSEEHLFNIHPTGCSNVTLNLNFNEESNKRFDFSFVRKISSPNLKIKESNSSNENWACSNCNSSNPSNFNFCPTCSASNPKLALNIKRPMPMMEKDDNNWICSRCATKNDNIRIVCIFCFKSKNETLKRQKFDAGIQVTEIGKSIHELSESKWNCVECWAANEAEWEECACCCTKNPCKSSEQQKEAPKLIFSSLNTKQKTFDFCSSQPAFGTAIVPFMFGRDENPMDSEDKSNRKWNCPECWVENPADKAQCACCSTKNPNGTDGTQIKSLDIIPTIKFGSSNTQTQLVKPKFVFGQSALSKEEMPIEKEKSEKKWNCGECWVENTADKAECVCCSARNPSVANHHDNAPSTIFKFGQSVFNKEEKPRENDKSDKKWNCTECWVENAPDKGECACCSARNPSATSATQQSFTFGSTIKFGGSNTQLELGGPKFVFGSAKPIPETIKAQDSTNGITAAGEQDKSNKKWNCGECWVENAADKAECVCCSTRNPSVTNHHGNAPSTIFKFGQSSAADAIKFGSADNSIPARSLLEIATPGTNSNISLAAGTDGTKSIFQFGSSGSVAAINGIGNDESKSNAAMPTQAFQFDKSTNQQSPPVLSSSPSSDCLVFTFSSPKYLEVSACSATEQEPPPIDLVFEFASPLKY